MPFYHLEPVLNFTHVLRAYTDVDHFVEVRLLKDNSPMDCSEATKITLTADKTVLEDSAIDRSDLDKGIVRINFKGLATGAYAVPIVVDFSDSTIVFGRIRVFVEDTRRSDEITTFYYYPDTDEEKEEWNERYGDGSGLDDSYSDYTEPEGTEPDDFDGDDVDDDYSDSQADTEDSEGYDDQGGWG